MESEGLTYAPVGVTAPAVQTWTEGRHRSQITVPIGSGDACWTDRRAAVLDWAVKTRSGFRVTGQPLRATASQDYEVTFRVGPLKIREPVRVVAVVDEDDRCGFSYGTKVGHPVSGEEAFIVHRDPNGDVHLTVRSFTRPARGWRALAFPAFFVARQVLRRRYRKALV